MQTQRYVLLDGMRGVAALGVLLYHIGIYVGGRRISPHGYLAVDFFFVLSGFVVANAYSGRIDTKGFLWFAKVRLTRFLPLSTLGVALGLGYLVMRWVIQPSRSDSLPEIFSAGMANLFLVPKLWVTSYSRDTLFPTNNVLWSLSLELIANAVWSIRAIRTRNMAGALLAVIGLSLVAFGSAQTGQADLGWGLSNYFGGIGRAMFGFFTGALLNRFSPRVRPNIAVQWGALVMLCALLVAPNLGWVFDLAVIALVFPLLVYVSAMVGPEKSRALNWLGELSYPLYAIHYPVLMLIWAIAHKLKPTDARGFAIYLVILPIIGLAAAASAYDKRLREWLADPRRRYTVALGRRAA